MQMISSEAGTRLAKAYAHMLEIWAGNPTVRDAEEAQKEYEAASGEVAMELFEQGTHDLDGGES